MKKIVSNKLLLSILSLIVALLTAVSSVLAWFAMSSSNRIDSTSVYTSDYRINFSDEIVITQTLDGYSKERFFDRTASTFLELNNMGVGETIDISLKLYSEQNIDSASYSLGLNRISASFFDNSQYSFLGAFRINLLTLNPEDELEESGSDIWLAGYGEDAFIRQKVEIYSGIWGEDKKEDNTVTLNFRITLDLSQAQEVYGEESLTNLLIGQSAQIGAIYCILE